MLPVKFLFDNLGIKYTYDNQCGIKADIRGVDFSKNLSERKSHTYDFNIAGDMENWKFGKANGYVMGGAAYVIPVEQSGGKYDPIFNCDKLTPDVLVATNCDEAFPIQDDADRVVLLV